LHKIIITLAAVLSLSACTSTQQGAAIGAASGAALGAATTGTIVGTGVGAAIGLGAGAVAGELLGRNANNPDQCYYRTPEGRTVIDDCPQG
jgi:hypothetical protein